MPTTASQAQPLAEPQPPRKKRRSREPDWTTFYKNGLPKEIIVIDDTPEPERPNAPTAAAQTLANGRSHVVTNGGAPGSSAKKRKRDDEPTPYDPVHHSAAVGSHTPSKSTAASDRTNSAIHTTAATSLGSLSSNGQYEYDTTQSGQKRKRTTRQQIANEARRREAAIYTDALAHYRPPPYPPKKARDVHIKVVADPPHTKNIRVDDDDGHYIVVPDNDLTERCKCPLHYSRIV
jgi:dual-specificity kinase